MLRITLIVFSLIHLSFIDKTWTAEQFAKADPGNQFNLTTEEREIVKYINLCRLYPQDFIRYELEDYYGNPAYGYDLKNSKYRKSLITTLKKLPPMDILVLDAALISDAKCFANELGKAGRRGHKRLECPERKSAECISYGIESGKEIVLQLLIDHNVESLGHREICLDPSFKYIGCHIAEHLKYRQCAVLEFTR